MAGVEGNNTIVYKNLLCYKDVMKALKRSKGKIPVVQLMDLKLVKTAVYIRLDKKIVDFFKSSGRGWQTKMNYILAQYVDSLGDVTEGKRK